MELITALCDIWKRIIIINRVPKSSHHKEKLFLSFCFVSIWDDGYSLNLLSGCMLSLIIMLYTLNLHSTVWQVYLNKTGGKISQK